MFWNENVEPVMSLKVHQDIAKAQQKEIQRIEDNKNQAVENAKAIEKERDELKEMVREQNEADLFLTSFKIVEEIKAGKTKKDESLVSLQTEQQRLLAERQRIGAYITYPTQGFTGQAMTGSLYSPYV